ncbi:MAG: hypothetical protein WDA74_06215, partial [Spirochaetota bacterium]
MKDKKQNDIMFPMTKIIGDNILDVETGEVINTADAESRLVIFEQQIASGCIQIALALKTIRDENLYLARCNSMAEYIEKYLPISLKHAQKHLQIADAFNSKALKRFRGAPMNMLLEISRNEELLEEANDPGSDPHDVVQKAR